MFGFSLGLLTAAGLVGLVHLPLPRFARLNWGQWLVGVSTDPLVVYVGPVSVVWRREVPRV